MSELSYDEDISKNSLFIKIQQDHEILLETASLEKWIICLPRQDSMKFIDLNSTEKDFILGHFLIPNEELPGTHFVNLIGHSFELKGKHYLKRTSTSDGIWNIQFKEVFYTKDFCKIGIWCISSSLMNENCSIWKSETILETLDDAKRYLQETCNLKNVKDLKIMKEKECVSLDELRFEVMECTTKIYNSIRSNSNQTKIFKDSAAGYVKKCILWLVLYNSYPTIFSIVSTIVQRKEEEFNKALINMSYTEADDLQVSEDYSDGILSMIRNEISLIDNFRMPVEKLECFRKAFELIEKSRSSSQPSLDDLLIIIVHTIKNSKYLYWITTFSYIMNFLSLFDDNKKGFNEFILSTFEAAISFILDYKSSAVPIKDVKIQKTIYKSKEEFLEYFFYLIQSNDEKGIYDILNISLELESELLNIIKDTQNVFHSVAIESGNCMMCHPLCDCKDCTTKLEQNVPSINARNKYGQTGLHIAAKQGFAKILNTLLFMGLQSNITDDKGYQPLHYAARYGHQNVLLLLLHAKSDINAIVSTGETALILSAQHGHCGCVKAILFFADHMKIYFNINHRDANGNTALHLASKWGFLEIVESLLEYETNLDIQNKKGETAVSLAHNDTIRTLLLKNFRNK